MDPTIRAQDSLFDFLLDVMPDDHPKFNWGVFGSIMYDKVVQSQLLDLILGQESPELVIAAGEFLHGHDPALLARMVESYSATSDPSRREALARALARSHLNESVHPILDSICMGNEPRLQAAILKSFAIGSLSKYPELKDRWAPRIVNFVRTGDDDLRAAAAGALYGDSRPEVRQLLEDRLLNDPSPKVQVRCAQVVPFDGSRKGLHWTLAADPNRSPDVRAQCARQILYAESTRRITLSAEERQWLKALEVPSWAH